MRPSLAKRVPAVSYMMFLICGMLLYAKYFRYIHKIIGQYFLCRDFPSTALFKDQLIIEYRPQEQKSGIIIFPARLQTAPLRKIIFPGLAAVINADITRNLRSLVCSCVTSYYAFHLFPLLILFRTGCFLH